MTPRCLIALVAAVAAALLTPLGAQARIPCPAEQAAPTALNADQVSDAIFCLSNQIRAHHGLPALRRDARLDAAATLHSVDMGARNFFSHVNPDGLAPRARAAAQGYALGVGENIASGYPSARAVVVAWMGSAGHCRNILGSAADLGVGTALVGGPHYTQVLGDHFGRAVDEAPRSGCPYALNLDALGSRVPSLVAAPAATLPPATVGTAPTGPAVAAELSLRALALSSARVRPGRGATTISYTLSAPATVTFRVQRAAGSRNRYRTLPGRMRHSGRVGANRVRFAGRLGGSLRPGRYRLQALARDAAGTSARLVHARFEILRRSSAPASR